MVFRWKISSEKIYCLSCIFFLVVINLFIKCKFPYFSDSSPLGKQINCIVCHPTLPLTVTAHEDRHIRFFDNNTGKFLFFVYNYFFNLTKSTFKWKFYSYSHFRSLAPYVLTFELIMLITWSPLFFKLMLLWGICGSN